MIAFGKISTMKMRGYITVYGKEAAQPFAILLTKIMFSILLPLRDSGGTAELGRYEIHVKKEIVAKNAAPAMVIRI